MKKSDHPYEHSWAHQALLELICVPEMQPHERLEYRQKLHGGFPNLQIFKIFSVNWKMKYVYLWKMLSQRLVPVYSSGFLWFSTWSGAQLARIHWIPNPPFFLWCKETAWESMAVQLFHREEEWPALSTAGRSLHFQREATHKWHPVGISAALPHLEDFRTYLTHLHELPLPLLFISGKRPKLKWKLMCLLTSLLFMFVSFSLMHSVFYNELKNNNS